MKKYFSIILITVFFSISFSIAQAATPTVTIQSTNTSSVAKYSKFEITFSLSKTFPSGSFLPYYYYDPSDTPTNNTLPNRTSPYGVDGISIDTIFTTPSNKTLTVPSFYYQGYTRTRSGSYEVLNASGVPVWKTRFTPSEVGTYKYHITITDKEGSTRYPATGDLTFTATDSNAKGFIRVSSRDPRFFDYENGSSYVPISGQAQWWACCTIKSYFYDDKFALFKQYGVNLTRVWDENDGYALSLESTADHTLTDPEAIATPKGTNIDQADAFREDKIFESAEANDVAIQLTPHGDVYWSWDASIYNEGWNPNPVAFTNVYHMNYWKRNFRYRVARYGYSTSLLAWETWNEHGHILSTSDLYQFYQTFSAYERATDPYKHVLTTSQGSQAYSPGFWSSAANDIANYHDYMMISRYPASLTNDETNFVARFSQCLRFTNGSGCSLGIGDGSTWTGGPKPWIWGEIGILQDWNTVDPVGATGDGAIRASQNETWAGLFSPLGTAPVEWNTPDSASQTTIFQHQKIARNFFSTIDYNAYQFDSLPTADISIPNYTGDKLTSSDTNLRAIALRSQDKKTVLVWVQNKNYTWKNTGSLPAAASGNITIPNIATGTYSTEFWDTSSGTITPGSTVTANGSLSFSVSNLQKSVAVKLISTTASTITPTKTPTTIMSPTVTPSTAPTVTPIQCTGDINLDGRVDLTDYSILVLNFLKQPVLNPSADLNKDNRVDLSDYSILVTHFLKPCS